MFDKVFLKHPREVGESYGEHFATATGFGARMVVGGLACIVHGVIPALFVRTASETVKALYGRMKARQVQNLRRIQIADSSHGPLVKERHFDCTFAAL